LKLQCREYRDGKFSLQFLALGEPVFTPLCFFDVTATVVEILVHKTAGLLRLIYRSTEITNIFPASSCVFAIFAVADLFDIFSKAVKTTV